MSQDGFIAKPDGDVTWLEQADVTPQEAGLDEFFTQIDGLIMGRKTYEFVFGYGSWPYGDKPSWICTSKPLQTLPGAKLNVTDSIEQAIHEITACGLQHVWLVGGGKLASSFLSRGLLTDISITEIPVSLRKGIPVFADHELQSIDGKSHRIVDHEKFRQIEISL